MRVAEVMNAIPTPLSPESSLLEAARQMAELGTTALPVCDGGRLLGILSERALVWGAVQEDSDGDEVPATEGRVARAMVPVPLTCRVDETLDQVMARVDGSGARHVVVLDAAGAVVGMLNLRAEWISEAPTEGALR
jgi:CBS domain-containing protein